MNCHWPKGGLPAGKLTTIVGAPSEESQRLRMKALLERSLASIEERTTEQYAKEWERIFSWVKPGQLFRVTESGSGIFTVDNETRQRIEIVPSIDTDAIIMFVRWLNKESFTLGHPPIEFEKEITGPLWLLGEKLLVNKIRVDHLEPISSDDLEEFDG